MNLVRLTLKTVLSLLIISIAPFSLAENITLKSGDTYQARDKDMVTCIIGTCTVKFHYVGSKFIVTMPNGKEHGRYDKKEEAIASARDLLALKTCDKVDLDL